MLENVSSRTIGDLLDSGVISATTGFPYGAHAAVQAGVTHVRPFNVTPLGEISLDQIKAVPEAIALARPRLELNDIVFNNTNTKELVGKCAAWNHVSKPAFSNHMTRIRVLNGSCNSDYLGLALLEHWLEGKSEMLARAHVAQASIMGERFREITLAWPDHTTQAGIAAALGLVRRALRLESMAVDCSVRLKQAAMRELITCGLRAEGRVEREFGRSPGSWSLAALSDVSDVQTGAAKGRRFGDAEVVEVPYLRVANVQDGHLDLREMKQLRIRRSEIERYRLQDGDVVLTEGGDFDKLGRGFIWRSELPLCIHQNHVFAVRTNRDVLLPDFFAYLAQSHYGKAYFLQVAHKTTNLASINSTKLKAFPVLLPNLTEQQQIVDILDAVDRKIDIHKRKRFVLEDLFKSLLHKLMTGEIRVSDLALSALDHPKGAEVPV